MLVLTRSIDQSITLTDEESGKVIEVVVCEFRSSNQVRIGIKAHKTVRVRRSEVPEQDDPPIRAAG